jgi:hypothetical protein
VGGFTTNSKPIVKIMDAHNQKIKEELRKRKVPLQ